MEAIRQCLKCGMESDLSNSVCANCGAAAFSKRPSRTLGWYMTIAGGVIACLIGAAILFAPSGARADGHLMHSLYGFLLVCILTLLQGVHVLRKGKVSQLLVWMTIGAVAGFVGVFR